MGESCRGCGWSEGGEREHLEEGAGAVHTRATGQVPGAGHLRSRVSRYTAVSVKVFLYHSVGDGRYGWWSVQRTADTGLLAPPRHHIADSAWLKERLRVLAADYGLKRR